LKNPFPTLRDFDFHLKTYIFVIFDGIILTWKKTFLHRWKIFAKINVEDSIDKFSIAKYSNLMITTSYFQNKSNLWNFSNGKISFCGRFFLKEKIAALGNSEKSNHFVLGSTTGKLYVYTNFGVLKSIISQTNNFKKNFYSVDPFPLKFSDHNILFSGGSNKQLCRWDIRTPKIVSYWQGHTGKILQIDCPNSYEIKDSSLIASSDNLGIIKIWDIRKEKEFLSIRTFPRQISSICIT
jgi:WD40 repeat protein